MTESGPITNIEGEKGFRVRASNSLSRDDKTKLCVKFGAPKEPLISIEPMVDGTGSDGKMIDEQGHIGRVFGQRVMEIRFRTPSSEKLQVGEMLVVEDESSDTKYLVRTMDIEHGADMEAPDWMEREASLMLHKDSAQETVLIDNLLDRLYKVGVSTPLGYIEDNVFRKTKSIPTHFSRVRRTLRKITIS